jgi:hypothetical protein
MLRASVCAQMHSRPDLARRDPHQVAVARATRSNRLVGRPVGRDEAAVDFLRSSSAPGRSTEVNGWAWAVDSPDARTPAAVSVCSNPVTLVGTAPNEAIAYPGRWIRRQSMDANSSPSGSIRRTRWTGASAIRVPSTGVTRTTLSPTIRTSGRTPGRWSIASRESRMALGRAASSSPWDHA